METVVPYSFLWCLYLNKLGIFISVHDQILFQNVLSFNLFFSLKQEYDSLLLPCLSATLDLPRATSWKTSITQAHRIENKGDPWMFRCQRLTLSSGCNRQWSNSVFATQEKKERKQESRLLPEAVHLPPGKPAGLTRSAKCMKNSQMSQ